MFRKMKHTVKHFFACWRFRLEQKVGRRRRPNLGALNGLPPELVLEIQHHLDHASQICLAMTCRSLFCCSSTELVCRELRTREAFLSHMEKDWESLYLCYRCLTLHSWRRDPELRCPRRAHGPEGTMFLLDCHLDEICVNYNIAHVVMNRHLWGETHGPGLDALERNVRKTHACGAEYTRTCSARVIDDDLLLSSVITMSARSSSTLRWYVDNVLHSVCRHRLTSKTCGEKSALRQMEELTAGSEAPNFFICGQGSTRACFKCMTDYTVDISSGETTGEAWKVTVTSWLDLGPCRSPEEWKWNLMVGGINIRMTDWRSSQPHSATYGPGVVRQKWTSVDTNSVVSAEGTWSGASFKNVSTIIPRESGTLEEV